jgi:ABC-type polysaccharide/polyol phosphate export permease
MTTRGNGPAVLASEDAIFSPAEPAEEAEKGLFAWVGDLRDQVRELWAYRELLIQFTRRDISIRYKQAVIGVAWAVLTPLVVVLSGWVLSIAFGRLSGRWPTAETMAGVAVKSLGWAFFVGAFSFGTASITGHLALITKTYFPRAVLPIASVLTQLVDAGIGALALLIALPLLGVKLSVALLWTVPLVLLLILFTTGVTLAASCANVFFRDAKHVVQIILSFGIFFTPIFFNADAFGPTGSRIVMLNPIAPLLEGLRIAVVKGHNLAQPLAGLGSALAWRPSYLVYAAAWAILVFVASMVIFRRAEFDFAEYV